jgi:hypothetical protein
MRVKICNKILFSGRFESSGSERLNRTYNTILTIHGIRTVETTGLGGTVSIGEGGIGFQHVQLIFQAGVHSSRNMTFNIEMFNNSSIKQKISTTFMIFTLIAAYCLK